MFYCKAYFKFENTAVSTAYFNASEQELKTAYFDILPNRLVELKAFKQDKKIFDDFVVQIDEYFNTVTDEPYKVLNKEDSDKVYPDSSLKLILNS